MTPRLPLRRPPFLVQLREHSQTHAAPRSNAQGSAARGRIPGQAERELGADLPELGSAGQPADQVEYPVEVVRAKSARTGNEFLQARLAG